jgi:hypothetical protein
MILEVTFLEFLLNCLRCKNCEYITVFILFYPCCLFTTTHNSSSRQQVTVLVPEVFIQMCKQEQEITNSGAQNCHTMCNATGCSGKFQN